MSPKGQERVALHIATLKRCDLVRRVNPGPRQKHQFLVKSFSQFSLQPTVFYFLSFRVPFSISSSLMSLLSLPSSLMSLLPQLLRLRVWTSL